MKVWKSKKAHKQGVWVSEICLKECGFFRKRKVNKLLKLLEKEGFDAPLP